MVIINFGIFLVIIYNSYFNFKILTITSANIFGGYYSSTYLPKILIKAHIWFRLLGLTSSPKNVSACNYFGYVLCFSGCMCQ